MPTPHVFGHILCLDPSIPVRIIDDFIIPFAVPMDSPHSRWKKFAHFLTEQQIINTVTCVALFKALFSIKCFIIWFCIHSTNFCASTTASGTNLDTEDVITNKTKSLLSNGRDRYKNTSVNVMSGSDKCYEETKSSTGKQGVMEWNIVHFKQWCYKWTNYQGRKVVVSVQRLREAKKLLFQPLSH